MCKRRYTFGFIMLAFLLLVPASGAVLAQGRSTKRIEPRHQDKSVNQIRRLYEEIGKKIELSEKGIEDSQYVGIFCNELVVNKNKHVWPVVGNYEMSYKFYYELAHTEGHEYPDRLRKVVMKSSMSDRSYSAEYLFDESGALVFYLSEPNEPPIGDEPEREQQRIYFAGGRPIKVVNAQQVSVTLSAKDLALVKEVVRTSRQIKLFFAQTLTLPNDK